MFFRNHLSRRAVPGLLILLIFSFNAYVSNARSPAEIFAPYNAGSQLEVDHSWWQDILDTYLDINTPSGVNLFNYAAVSPTDKSLLDNYIRSLEAARPPELNRDEQMAYWINFYNALTVQVILNHYPVDSIRDISLPGSRGGPWKASLVTVTGVDLSLDDIEHGILRPIWKDKRIHYAVNCASFGCPNLAGEAYRAANLEEMLDIAAKDYINHPRGVRVEGSRITLSSIYKWYSEDFGTRDELMTHLIQYADPETRSAIQRSSGRIRYDYDWSLNGK